MSMREKHLLAFTWVISHSNFKHQEKMKVFRLSKAKIRNIVLACSIFTTSKSTVTFGLAITFF